ncbi:MAG TPA: cytochrome b/b6 domain-containing protein [Novimethylophilus sp.]|jgi:cytochrome b|uniref:cytochrome b/b6 domain-containing protein n=1 Tax=Novimethylophilus sp. TaxID=2137426 RepID=UPI002F419499
MSRNAIKVWDPLLRCFHWSLVVLFTVAFVTGDEESAVHIDAGYAVMALVIFRIVWGFVGSEHARFKDFIFAPATVIGYLKALLGGKPQHYLGHNPAGGYMVVLMLTTLLVVTVTGLEVYAQEGHGPLASNDGVSIIAVASADGDSAESRPAGEGDAEEYWKEVHEAAAYFMLALIAIHLMGVAVSSLLHKENLVKAMLTGNKESSQP